MVSPWSSPYLPGFGASGLELTASTVADANALLCSRYNLRLILNHLRRLLRALLQVLSASHPAVPVT